MFPIAKISHERDLKAQLCTALQKLALSCFCVGDSTIHKSERGIICHFPKMYICHYVEGNYEEHKKQKIEETEDELQEAIGRIVSHENYHGIRALVKEHC